MRRYVEAAVDSEIQSLRQTSSGRACATFRAAAVIGGFVGAGEVERSVAEGALLAAALETGLPEREAIGHIRRGLRCGEKTPRTVPDAPFHQGPRARSADGRAPAASRPTAAEAAPVRPPLPEVNSLWNASLPVGDVEEAVAWFACRFGPASFTFIQQTELWDLARVIAADARLPRWAWSPGGPWHRSGHRLIFRLWDHMGHAVSLRARSIAGGDDPKSLAPSGCSVKGLVLADPLGSRILGGECPAWWQPREVVVAEGEPDWLLWAAQQPEAQEQGPACFGIESGAWSAQIAARIPTGASVVVRTHHDEPGERYARQIAVSLQGRCPVFRGGATEEVPR